MPLASEVAAELRKFADRLDTNPEAKIKAPTVLFYHWSEKDKEAFLEVAKLMPRPVVKGEDTCKTELQIRYQSPAMEITAAIPKSISCKLVEPARPAVYDCITILSPEEDAELEVANG